MEQFKTQGLRNSAYEQTHFAVADSLDKIYYLL